MNTKQMSDLLSKIASRVHGDGTINGSGTAPVQLRIGYVNNICLGDGIVIIDAPAVITTLVYEWVDLENAEDGHVSMSAGFGGLLVR
jgi:hypothetical protein